MLNEQFRKHSKLQEDQINENAKELRNMAVKTKKLQEFFDKHDTILNEREAELQGQIIKIRNEKDEEERKLQKELDEKKTQLETLEGEFQVKMMKIRLGEIELENKIKDTEEQDFVKTEQIY